MTAVLPVALRKRLGAARQQFDYVPLWRRGPAPIAYVGWLGHLNAGDDAMFEAHRQLFPDVDFWNVPNLGANLGLRVSSKAPWTQAPVATFLGGGTLIGNGHFRRTLDAWFEAFPDVPAAMLSAGVEDPAFEGPRGRDSAAELAIWGPLLGRFDKVRVRGPRSKEILDGFGIESEIVGDPALMLGAHLSFAPEERVLGLNVGQTDNMWGSQEELEQRTSELVRTMTDDGWTVRLFSVWPADDAVAERVASAGGAKARVVRYGGDVDGLIQDMGRCAVFVGEKLHSVILASCAHVPAIALEYRPKCRDFQASVDREELTVRTDQLEVSQLRDMIEALAEDRDGSSAQLASAVDGLRIGLRAAADDIAEKVGTRST